MKDLESHGLKSNVKLKRCAFLIICSYYAFSVRYQPFTRGSETTRSGESPGALYAYLMSVPFLPRQPSKDIANQGTHAPGLHDNVAQRARAKHTQWLLSDPVGLKQLRSFPSET